MKKVILLFLITAVMFSCKKNENPQPSEKYAEVTFNVTTLVPDAGRDWTYDYDIPECDPDAIPVYALMMITDDAGAPLTPPEEVAFDYEGNTYFKVLLFYTNGELYTQSLKLPIEMCDNAPECCDIFYITEFYVFDEGGTMIKAAPAVDSEFYDFATQQLPVTLELCAFTKVELYIDVLCFTPDYYELFGFFWFEITEITIREICFFGDVCIEWWMDPSMWHDFGVPLWVWYPETGYNFYQDQQAGIQMDMPAIFALALWKYDPATDTWFFINSWSNEEYFGEGQPLCFRYADYDDIDGEEFAILMYIYGPWYYDGSPPPMRDEIFGYTNMDESRDDVPGWATGMPQHIWYFTDNALEDLDTNDDGVIEFAWGDCVENPEYPLPDLYWLEQ
ncbi:MAG: hypothetical protein DRJ02_10570 [Bacteroidetes bacterium]|nr:MAG: hypothetical protein DRI87_07985 [Bacteroidota bacterium]RLD85340.1 MAG: hypothetical protein DRJ02_10570 [Bacteroidota bacterium]